MTMSRRWKAFGLVVYLAGISFVVQAQPSELPQKNIIFEQLPEKLGLSQSSINCTLQDREGFLWVGTWSGLIRYDGYSTTVFHSDNAPDKIKSNKITTIYEDRKGNIWVGTLQGGLFRYNKNTNTFDHFKNSEDQNSLSDNNIWAIQEDKDGVLWVGTEHGLNRWNENKNTFKRFFTVDGDSLSLSQDIVTDLF